MTDEAKTTIKDFGKSTVVPIQFGLLIALVAGVWALANSIGNFSNRLGDLEKAVQWRWSYHMERRSWYEFKEQNPTLKVPDVSSIRADFE